MKNIKKTALIDGFYEEQVKKNKHLEQPPRTEETGLYGESNPETPTQSMPEYPSNTLSTRYVPGMEGVQAGRIPGQEGGFYNPITKKEYNFQQGFSMDGVDYPAYSVSMQTNLYSLAKKLKELGFNKQANKILTLIK